MLNNVKIKTMALPINRIEVDFLKDPSECKSRKETDRNTRIKLPDGRRLHTTDRFWTSFCSLQSQGRSVFDLFAPSEVFDRIHKKKKDTVRIAIEEDIKPDVGGTTTHGRLLSMTNPLKPVLGIHEVKGLVDRFNGDNVTYEDGVVTAAFDCPFPTPYQVAGEEYRTRFSTSMPIDGYGLPCAYLVMLRMLCQNGVFGMAKAFKTQFQLGKGDENLSYVLNRAMETFTAEEGFHSFKQRMESAATSWASLHEASQLHKLMTKSMGEDGYALDKKVQFLEKFDNMCGNPLAIYGLSNATELSARRARTIPVNASIYQLITFASEMTTHHLSSQKARDRINSWIGTLITNEYDMEGTMEQMPSLDAFFVDPQNN